MLEGTRAKATRSERVLRWNTKPVLLYNPPCAVTRWRFSMHEVSCVRSFEMIALKLGLNAAPEIDPIHYYNILMQTMSLKPIFPCVVSYDAQCSSNTTEPRMICIATIEAMT